MNDIGEHNIENEYACLGANLETGAPASLPMCLSIKLARWSRNPSWHWRKALTCIWINGAVGKHSKTSSGYRTICRVLICACPVALLAHMLALGANFNGEWYVLGDAVHWHQMVILLNVRFENFSNTAYICVWIRIKSTMQEVARWGEEGNRIHEKRTKPKKNLNYEVEVETACSNKHWRAAGDVENEAVRLELSTLEMLYWLLAVLSGFWGCWQDKFLQRKEK